MRVAPNFILQEFVHPTLYDKFGANSLRFVDQRLIDIAQAVADITKVSITINDYAFGGKFKNRGVRLPDSPFGAYYSMHKQGRAIDLSAKKMTAQEIYSKILGNKDFLFKLGLRRLEDIHYTPTWVHLDIANTGLDDIQIVAPSQRRTLTKMFTSNYELYDI